MSARDLISKVRDIPPVSAVAVRLAAMLNRPTQHNDEVLEVVRLDSVLTARLLRTCNSPYFALRQRVGSVDQAVLLLGHQAIIRIVLALSFGGALSKPLPGYAVEESGLWRHSLATALAAERVAAHGATLDPSMAFTAGLVHDIGKLVLNHVLTPEIQTTIRARISQNADSRIDAERAVLGADHAEVGACLLKDWGIPESIVEAVANHHAPGPDGALRLSALVHVANCVAHLTGQAPGWESYAIRADETIFEALKLTALEIEQIIISVHDSLRLADEHLAVT